MVLKICIDLLSFVLCTTLQDPPVGESEVIHSFTDFLQRGSPAVAAAVVLVRK